jgi:hypothetical protein
MSDLENQESQKRLSLLRTEIATGGAKSDLEELVDAGCEQDKILLALSVSSGRPIDWLYDGWFNRPGPLTRVKLFGLDSHQFDALKKLLMRAATQIDSINRRFDFGVLLQVKHLHCFQGLPRLLQAYVSLLDLAAERLGRGAHFYRNLGKAILVQYVKRKTGRPLHRQVSALLAAVHDDDDYDVTKHQDWLKENAELLDRVFPLLPIFESKDPDLLLESLFRRAANSLS